MRVGSLLSLDYGFLFPLISQLVCICRAILYHVYRGVEYGCLGGGARVGRRQGFLGPRLLRKQVQRFRAAFVWCDCCTVALHMTVRESPILYVRRLRGVMSVIPLHRAWHYLSGLIVHNSENCAACYMLLL